jgi:hypothetical protein
MIFIFVSFLKLPTLVAESGWNERGSRTSGRGHTVSDNNRRRPLPVPSALQELPLSRLLKVVQNAR